MNCNKLLKVATRKSRLAICQAQYVCRELKRYHPNLIIELIPIITTGDKFLNVDLENDNRKIQRGVFIKELEHALIEHRADIAVHSMKDITTPLPKELIIPVICKRNDPRDVFVSLKYSSINTLPAGATIGTSSLRRQCQIRAKRSDLMVINLRGNIDTRLKTLYHDRYDAIILAAAGLNRLNLNRYVRTYFDITDVLPAMGQGAIAIECRLEDSEILSLLSPLYHRDTSLCIHAESAVTTYLESYCRFPIASYAEIKDDQVWLRALIGLPDGSKIIRTEGRAPLLQAEKLGFILAENFCSYMGILITRPSPDGEQLVNKLLAIGRVAYHLPLIYFSKGKNLSLLKKQINLLSAGDFVFIISRYAVLYAHNYLLNIGMTWPEKLVYYSIGKATSVKMRDLSGISVNYPKEQETSEGLLELLELICLNRKKILILRGNDGRTILEDVLRKRGAYVTCCECYSRNVFHYNGTEQYIHMLSLNINIVVVTSAGMLIQLYYLIPTCYRTWLIKCQLIVASVRLAICAKQLGWENVIVAFSANNDVLIQVIKQYT